MKQKVVACIIARTDSNRLPNKVILEINDKMLIEYIIEKMKLVKEINEIYMCTTREKEDQVLIETAEKHDIKGYKGSTTSPISRMIEVGEIEDATHLIRITGDNIFTDEIFLSYMIKKHIENEMEYTRTEMLPLGISAEIMQFNALKRCLERINPDHSEYLTYFMFDPEYYKCQVLIPPKNLQRPYYLLTVDTPEDLKRTERLVTELYKNNRIFLDDIIEYLETNKVATKELSDSDTIKLVDKRISYKEWREIIERRIKHSHIIELGETFYNDNK
jgi:spore coat polysaccharide biosynthesis protein SpsF